MISTITLIHVFFENLLLSEEFRPELGNSDAAQDQNKAKKRVGTGLFAKQERTQGQGVDRNEVTGQ